MNSKGQGLALNTIVIAILVIIVLLVIIVFFTTQVGNTGDQIKENNPSTCSIENPAISTLGYVHAEYSTASNNYEEQCQLDQYEVVSIVPKNDETFNYNGKTFEEGAVCCATRNKSFS